ncbi:MAG: HD domain-containing phosphohydrolase [Syntrophales bacterium]|nr:HD domain-containing phosphohydrolase [Syntrophales bacterium]
MVRYSDIIKKDIKKSGRGDPKYPIDTKKADDSLRFSTLKEFSTSSELNALPAQKDAEYMKKLHATIVAYLKEVQRLVKNDEDFDISPAVDIVKHIINTPDLIEKFYQSTALNDYNNQNDYLILHLINVMTSSLKIGTGMKFSKKELLELGLAALFYDIGFFKVPENILEKRGNLTESELDIMKKHTEFGKDILSRFQTEHPMLPRVAYEHHERENGSGYPAQLKEDEICEYAKIMGLVDTFDAMINNRPYRKAFEQHVSIKELVESKNTMFSSKIIKAFLNEIGIFPIGSYVRLNNMEIGKVVATSKSHPLKPTIKFIFDIHGKKVPGKTVIKLEEHPVLYVTAAVSEKDLPTE